MDAMNTDTFTSTVGIGYHPQGLPVPQKADAAREDDNHAPATTPEGMIGEAAADPTTDLTSGTEVAADQDTVARTGTQAGIDTLPEDAHLTAAEPKADLHTDSTQVADHPHPTLGTALEADPHHAAQKHHQDVV